MSNFLFTFINHIKSIIYDMLELFRYGRKTLTNSLSINVKTKSNETIQVDLNPRWDIKNVKEMIAPQLGMQVDEIRIIFAGKELGDDIKIGECDLGEQSVLHAVKTPKKRTVCENIDETGEEDSSKPMCETLVDLQLTEHERKRIKVKAHFYVYCGACQRMTQGKLRVCCSYCKSGAFVVDADPQSWDDVLKPNRITGHCEVEHENKDPSQAPDVPFAEFYFKCAEHPGTDQVVPLALIKPNLRAVICMACAEVETPVFVFPCKSGHVVCLDCFRLYCGSNLRDRQFWPHETYGYTLGCPANCADSFIEEPHHFRLLTEVQYAQYQRFATEEFILRQGGVFCPQAGCGTGILVDNCDLVICPSCGYTWNRLQVNNSTVGSTNGANGDGFNVSLSNVSQALWKTEEATVKGCPKCAVPTERDGGCMHMICPRGSCKFQWCWVCHTAWTRECMGSHWFG